jgi:hypothetical protein
MTTGKSAPKDIVDDVIQRAAREARVAERLANLYAPNHVLANLIRARDLVERSWTKGAPARRNGGKICPSIHPLAEQWSTFGALQRSSYEVATALSQDPKGNGLPPDDAALAGTPVASTEYARRLQVVLLSLSQVVVEAAAPDWYILTRFDRNVAGTDNGGVSVEFDATLASVVLEMAVRVVARISGVTITGNNRLEVDLKTSTAFATPGGQWRDKSTLDDLEKALKNQLLCECGHICNVHTASTQWCLIEECPCSTYAEATRPPQRMLDMRTEMEQEAERAREAKRVADQQRSLRQQREEEQQQREEEQRKADSDRRRLTQIEQLKAQLRDLGEEVPDDAPVEQPVTLNVEIAEVAAARRIVVKK